MSKLQWLREALSQLEAEGLFNKIRIVESAQGPYIVVDGRKVLNFCSNNYLGLATDPQLIAAVKQAIDKYGIGPAAVRTICGTMILHQILEQRIANFKEVEDAITFQSGFNANLGTISAIVDKEDVIFSDELNHASIIDGCRLSKAKIVRYPHCDIDGLENAIKEHLPQARRGLVVTDAVFSMDGDIAPLPAICKLAKQYNLIVMVDDAHGEGVLGKGGRGAVHHFGLNGEVDIEVGTFSKAFGVVGGIVAGKHEIIEWLRQRARPFLFSSAMTVADVAASLAAIDILENSPQRIEKLWENTRYFQNQLRAMGFDIGKTQTPITPIMLGEAVLADQFAKMLFDQGIFVVPITYPTVPKGKARVRVMISAMHTQNDLDMALEAFGKVGKALGVI